MEKVNKKIIQFFSSLADETRLKILICLTNGSKTVNEIYDAVGKNITLSAISHQLKHLYNLEIINYEKLGREKRYRLSDEFCWCILRDALKHFDNFKLKNSGGKK